jgi:hypothetical protein
MAHECPDCGYVCHCGGDIDDCVMNSPRDVNKCIHCDGKYDCDNEDEDCAADTVEVGEQPTTQQGSPLSKPNSGHC